MGKIVTLCMFFCSTSIAENEYVVTDLSTLGGTSARARAINNNGVIAGGSTTSDGSKYAFRYVNGVMENLGCLVGDYESDAQDINDAGQIVGRSEEYPVFFEPPGSKRRSEGTFELHTGPGDAIAINEIGWITGKAQNANNIKHAFLYRSGSVQDLGSIIEGGNSAGLGVNIHGTVVGGSTVPGGEMHPCIFPNATAPIDLGTFGGPRGAATDINDYEVVVGQAQDEMGFSKAFIWFGQGEIVPLGTLGGDVSVATAINNMDTIVGYSTVDPGILINHACTWTTDGIIDIHPADFMQSEAFDINDEEIIVGIGIDYDGNFHALRWLPLGNCDSNIGVDLSDHADFVDCMSGPGIALYSECDCGDFDRDCDVDHADFAGFQNNFGF